MIDETANAMILRWPRSPQVAPQPKRRTIRRRLGWLAFPIWLVRLAAEMVGWLALLGMASIWF